MIGALPKSLTVGDKDYLIHPDCWNVLRIFEAFNDPELEEWEKWIVAIFRIFDDFSCADDVFEAVENGFDTEEAAKQINWFISAGKPHVEDLKFPMLDWEQDEQMIFSAINEVAGKEVREIEHMHWWTLAGYLNSTDKDSNLNFVMAIRYKLGKGKKLEKYERDYLNHNKETVLIKPKRTKEEQEQEDEYQALLNEVLG